MVCGVFGVWYVVCGVCVVYTWCVAYMVCVWCVVCMVCGVWCVCVVYAWCVAYMMCVLCVVRARVCGARPVCSTRVPVFSLLQHRHRRAPAALLCSAAAHGLGALFRTEDPGCDRREIQRQEEKSEIGRKIRTRNPLA